MSSNTSNNRGWLEGTLDVISGMAPRPSNPPGTPSSAPMRAPESPGRGSGGLAALFGSSNNNANNSNVGLSIPRLPSQDSLDRSIHNDSGHGNKPVAQIIRELKQSNARLTARTAEIEADFMNQMTVNTRNWERQLANWLSEQKRLEKSIGTLEQRCKTSEMRLREKEDQLAKFKEESAFQRHTISELKTQLFDLEKDPRSSPNGARGVIANDERESLLQQIEQLKQDCGRHKAENIELTTKVNQLLRIGEGSENNGDAGTAPGSSWKQLERTQKDLLKSEKALADLQAAQKQVQMQHDKRVQELKDEMLRRELEWHKTKSELQSKVDALPDNTTLQSPRSADSTSSLHQQLVERDECVAELREQIVDLNRELTELTSQLAAVKAEADRRDTYRREEADDLRVLNDAQEEEIASLRKQLEEALEEIQARDEELRENGDLDNNKSNDGELLEESQVALNKLRHQLEESKQQMKKLQQELETTTKESSVQLSQLQQRIADLIAERDSLSQLATHVATGEEKEEAEESEIKIKILKETLADLQKKYSSIEIELRVAREALDDAEEEKKEIELTLSRQLSDVIAEKQAEIDDLASKLRSTDREIVQRSSFPTAGQSTSDSARIDVLSADLEASPIVNQENPRALQCVGSNEEELRKQLEYVRQSEIDIRNKLEAIIEEKDFELAELKEKLEDRDTTISALVKASVSLEQQIATSQLEVDALRKRLEEEIGEADVDALVEEASTCNGEVDELRRSLEAYKETKEKLTHEIYRLRKQSHNHRQEVGRLKSQVENMRAENLKLKSLADEDTGSTAGSTTGSAISNSLGLKERDEAIARLVKQSMAQDRLVSDLRSQLTEASRRLDTYQVARRDTPSWEEVKQLRQEAEVFAGQVIELDEEIESLKDTIREREERISALQKDLSAHRFGMQRGAPLNNNRVRELEAEVEELKAANGAHKEEIRVLRRKLLESEAPLDESWNVEQVDVLKSELKEKDQKIKVLESEIGNLRRKNQDNANEKRILELTAEIDELKEANAFQNEELRVLRRQVRDLEMAPDQIARAQRETLDARKEAEEYQSMLDQVLREKREISSSLEEAEKRLTELQSAAHSKPRELFESPHVEELENKLAERDRIIGELKKVSSIAKPKDTDEFETEALKSQIEKLKHELSTQASELSAAKRSIRELEQALATQSSEQAAALEEEKEELLLEVENLTQQLERTKAQLHELESERVIIDEFKMKLEEADDAREQSEKSIVDSYERKLSLLKLDKDVTIDKLRKELAETKEEKDAEVGELSQQITEYEMRMNEMKDEMVSQLQQREGRIYALEATLEAQEQLVTNMRTEMDQLQGSMENTAVGRREEIEDMQKELSDLTATVARQEREITSLRLQLDEKELTHKTETDKLRDTIKSLEAKESTSQHRNAQDLQMELRLQEVKDRLEKLKWRNTSLKEENETLRERLQKAEERLLSGPMAADVAEASALKDQLEETTSRIVELETELESAKKKVEDTQREVEESKKEVEAAKKEADLAAAAAVSLPTVPKTSAAAPQVARQAARKQAAPPQMRLRGFLRRRGGANDAEETDSK